MRLFSSCSSVLVLAAALVGSASAARQPREYYEERFVNWMKEHDVQFESGAEFAHRLGVFADNHDFIMEHNRRGNSSVTLAHNAFSHLTLNEFHHSMGLGEYRKASSFLQQKVARIGNNKKHHHLGDGLRRGPLNGAPEAVDWVGKGGVTPVKDQKQCGSCWAFSATGSLEGAYYLSHGSLVSFSEQNLVDCDGNDNGCGGGLMDHAFLWIQQNHGLASEEAYPYTGLQQSCNRTAVVVPDSKLTKFIDVDINSDAALTEAVAKQPVSIAIEADEPVFQFYSSGVLTGNCGTNLDHGVLTVGYGVDGPTGVAYYKVKNSWGSGWGEGGYIRLQKGKPVYGGQCGLLLAASYPIFT